MLDACDVKSAVFIGPPDEQKNKFAESFRMTDTDLAPFLPAIAIMGRVWVSEEVNCVKSFPGFCEWLQTSK